MSPSSPAGSSSSSIPFSNTLLALPDGPIAYDAADLRSHTVSYIGGYPTFPALSSAEKAPDTIKCGVCHEAIPLLAQVYCPPEDGENDRTVYVWACPRTKCQRRDGSVRAYRASARNEEYVRDVEEKRKQREKDEAEERERARKNPFSQMPDSNTNGSTLFGGGQSLFGGPPPSSTPPTNPFSTSSESQPPDLSSLSISKSNTTHAPPLPAYQPAQYLSTIDEYLPPPDEMDVDVDDKDETPAQAAEWRNERWEQLLPEYVDEVFERFVHRLENAEGGSGQVLRYELNGVPLPYSSTSKLYRQLFPEAPTSLKPSDENNQEVDLSKLYAPKDIPPCPRCGAKRVFELQLVPSLISALQPDSLSTTGRPAKKGKKNQTEEERKKELARLAGGLGDEGGLGEMEWGTVLVFGCSADCTGVGEEWVAVEWEATLSNSSA
ncbi:programmed cell death protein 2 [Naematelia encephala]|uniref:Programmed cell death protein 2 n=1 Tax=Naematelia encephala TaxID=71784 RepID=A0A1Y2BAM4_9TREE|nr:programmed cell death protein 2 [Naematelia encephala]